MDMINIVRISWITLVALRFVSLPITSAANFFSLFPDDRGSYPQYFYKQRRDFWSEQKMQL